MPEDPNITTFEELTTYLKSLTDEQRKSVWTWEDEGIVRVEQGHQEDINIQLFSAEMYEFANAFFGLLGIDSDIQ